MCSCCVEYWQGLAKKIVFLKYSHDIVISFLEPIEPGKDKNNFISDLEEKIYSSIDGLN